MENLKKFLSLSYGDGNGYNSGYDDGSGFGYGICFNSGYDDGSGFSDGICFNSGSDYGLGFGYGEGFSDGSDYGLGSGDGVITINGNKVNNVDGIQTVVTQLKNNIAKGYILNSDLTLTPCYIAKIENSFAHADTIKEAVKQASEKAFLKMPIEKRIEEFWKCHNDTDKYPARDLWIWHNKLTDSCEMGRNQFVAEKGIDINNDSFTVKEFVEMCKDRYGGEIILRLNDK